MHRDVRGIVTFVQGDTQHLKMCYVIPTDGTNCPAQRAALEHVQRVVVHLALGTHDGDRFLQDCGSFDATTPTREVIASIRGDAASDVTGSGALSASGDTARASSTRASGASASADGAQGIPETVVISSGSDADDESAGASSTPRAKATVNQARRTDALLMPSTWTQFWR